MPKYLILDTNILLLDANNLLTLGKDHTIVIPETVLDEIDSKKTGKDPELLYQVREFFRIMTRRVREPHYTKNEFTIVPGVIDGNIRVETVSCSSYPDFKTAVPDSRIIYVATFYNKTYNDVTFMTNDIGCGERAVPTGLNVTDLKLVNTDETEFTKEVTVTPAVFATLHNAPIAEVDPEYKPENYNYVFKDKYSGQIKLANIRNRYIDILGKETEKELRQQDISPKNTGQLFLSRAIQNSHVDIVICEASAGTGKTLTAFSNAIQLVKRGEYKGITYIRTSVDDVEKAEENGFRSGNEEKDAPFFGPVEDTLGTIIRSRYKNNKRKSKEFEEFVQEQIFEALEKYNIKTITTLGLRGKTFEEGEILIIDEGQNYSATSLQKTLTRAGKGCLILILGSNKQIDHPYVTKHNNGLSVLLDAARNEHDEVKLHVVPLTKILRSPVAEFAERTFSKEDF